MTPKETTEAAYRYIQFPLCLLRETYPNPVRGLDLILAYGIVNFALRQKYNMQDVVRQMFYDYYRNSEIMEPWLYRRIQSLEDGYSIILDDTSRFVEGKFNFAELEDIEYIIEQINSDPELKEATILNYQLHQAIDFLNVESWSSDDILKHYAEAKTLKAEFERKYGPDAMPTCKPSQLVDFRNNTKNIDLLRANIACRSILGQKSFASTNKNAIVRRMIGAKNDEVLQDFLDENTQPTYALYSKRYYFDKLKNALCERNFLMFLSRPHKRSIYISLFMPPERLADMINTFKTRRNANNLVKRMSVASTTLL
jgi:hypothetical protein